MAITNSLQSIETTDTLEQGRVKLNSNFDGVQELDTALEGVQTDVTALGAAVHDEVTLAADSDPALELVGQELNLTLPTASGGTAATTSYDPLFGSVVTASNVQGAIDQLASEVDTTNTALTQLVEGTLAAGVSDTVTLPTTFGGKTLVDATAKLNVGIGSTLFFSPISIDPTGASPAGFGFFGEIAVGEFTFSERAGAFAGEVNYRILAIYL